MREKDWNSQRVSCDKLGEWMNRCLDCEIFKNVKSSQLEVWLEVDVKRKKYGRGEYELPFKKFTWGGLEFYDEWGMSVDLE